MPIKWSAVKVSEAMDEVERQVSLAEAFFAEARAKASVALNIANLPQYIGDRIRRLIGDLDRIDNVKGAITSVRESIPSGAIEVERGRGKYGNQQSLV